MFFKIYILTCRRKKDDRIFITGRSFALSGQFFHWGWTIFSDFSTQMMLFKIVIYFFLSLCMEEPFSYWYIWKSYCTLHCGCTQCFDRMSRKLSVHLWLLYWCVQNKHADGNLWLYIRFCACVICFSHRQSDSLCSNFELNMNPYSPVLHTKINNAVIQQPVYLVNNLCMFLENTTYQLLFWAINTFLAFYCKLDMKLKMNN